MEQESFFSKDFINFSFFRWLSQLLLLLVVKMCNCLILIAFCTFSLYISFCTVRARKI